MLLRPYQNEAISLIRDGFKNGHKRIVLCLPTGAGKTVVFSEMVRLSAERGTRTVVLTNRTELFKQTFKSLSRINVPVQMIAAGERKFSPLATVTVAMVETLARRQHVLNELHPELIIIDEAHIGSFNKIIDAFPNARFIGATATPVGKHFHKYYTHMVANIDIPELVQQDYLVPCKAFQMQDDISDLETDSTGEYTEKSQFKHFNKSKLFDGVVKEYKTRCLGKKAIVFNVNIEHAENMTKAFKDAGIPSYCLTSNTSPEERNRILQGFKDGLFPVLNNANILTTGFDEPSIEVVIMNRATKSLPLFLQCCGRGSRLHPGKTHFTVLDFGMNHTEHGLWQEPRNWSIAPPKKKRAGVVKEAPIKKCQQCEAINPATARTCAYCGFDFPVNDKELPTGIMVELQPKVPNHIVGKRAGELELEQLKELQLSKKYKPTYVWRIVRSKGQDAIMQYAQMMGYKRGWIERQVKDIENSNYSNYILK